MGNLISRQKGLTLWGVIFLFAFIGVMVLFVLRAFPLYNEKMQVISAMNSVTTKPDAAEMSASEVRDTFYKQIQVTNIDRFSSRNLKDFVFVEKPGKQGEPRIMRVKYEARNKLFSDLYLLMAFDESKPLRGPEGGD